MEDNTRTLVMYLHALVEADKSPHIHTHREIVKLIQELNRKLNI